jgi:hypothetical protein
MNRTNQAQAIFLQAIEIDLPEKQQQFLSDACKDDTKLRDRVERLLASHRQLGSFHIETHRKRPRLPSRLK